jgi:dihydroorotate dehydrogenase electron transfer subunit
MAKLIEDLKLIENKRITDDYFVLELAGNGRLPEMQPGQFAQVRVDGSTETFLRRPVSIHDVDYEHNTLKLLVQVVGKGTETLSKLKKGDFLNLIYPLGNSFGLPEKKDDKVLLVGGGCGIAPLLFLGKYLKSNGYNPEILLGFRNKDRIIEIEEYRKTGKVYLTTEDGSIGEKGFVTAHPVLTGDSFAKIYCCGPEPMMKAIARFAEESNTECEVSLENLMACGIGACLCCIVETVKGNLCTCTEGPIFNIRDLKW